MTGRHKIFWLATLITFVTATCLWSAPNQIQKLGMVHENGFTILTIHGSGPFQVAHESVEAKDGKPFRIVIDCLATRHAMSKKNFDKLPNSAVKSIRTSQYSVKPEEVVRIVLDLNDETVYRVETDANTVKVLVSDHKTPSFSRWTSSTAKVAKISETKSPARRAKTPTTARTQKTANIKQSADSPTVAVITPPKATPPVKKPTTKKATSNKSIASIAVATSPKIAPAVKKPVTPKATGNKSTTGTKAPTVAKTPATATTEVHGPFLTQTTPKQKAPAAKKTASAKPTTTVAAKVKNNPTSANKSKQSQTVAKLTTAAKAEVAKPSEPKSKNKKAVPSTAKSKSQPSPAATGDIVFSSVPLTKAALKTLHTAQTEKSPVRAKPAAKKQTKPAASKDLAAQSKKKAQVFAAASKNKDKQLNPGRAPNHKTEDVHADKTKKVDNTQASKPPAIKGINNKKTTDKSKSGSQKKTTLAKLDTNEKNAGDKQVKAKTSRYRRLTAKQIRMKQTHVVKFPQRMVIKYSAAGTRDPFASLINEAGHHKGGIRSNKIPNIETLFLVGVLKSTDGKSSALLEDIDGIGYILKPGDRVKNGYVAQINNEAIYFQINEYGWSRTAVKRMGKDN